MEILLTAILVSVILHTATGARSIGHNAALAVGATVALLGLFAGPISGSSMNPARTLGPHIVAGDFTGWGGDVGGGPIRAAPPRGLLPPVPPPPGTPHTNAPQAPPPTPIPP